VVLVYKWVDYIGLTIHYIDYFRRIYCALVWVRSALSVLFNDASVTIDNRWVMFPVSPATKLPPFIIQTLDRSSTMYPIQPTAFRSIVARENWMGWVEGVGWISGLWGFVSATAPSILQALGPLQGLRSMHIYAGMRRYSCILYYDINAVLPTDQYRETQKGTKKTRKAQTFPWAMSFSYAKRADPRRKKSAK